MSEEAIERLVNDLLGPEENDLAEKTRIAFGEAMVKLGKEAVQLGELARRLKELLDADSGSLQAPDTIIAMARLADFANYMIGGLAIIAQGITENIPYLLENMKRKYEEGG